MGGAFLLQKRGDGMKEYKPFKIMCPLCKRKVATWDGRTTTPTVTTCERCYKRIVFNPISKKIEAKKVPPRNTSSGLTMW